MEHIIPRALNGSTDESNLALACQDCNNYKRTSISALDSESGEIVLLFHPRRDAWNDHFTWISDFTVVLGFTPTGRATVQALRLNRRSLVRVRRVLRTAGLHPPDNVSLP